MHANRILDVQLHAPVLALALNLIELDLSNRRFFFWPQEGLFSLRTEHFLPLIVFLRLRFPRGALLFILPVMSLRHVQTEPIGV